MDYIPASKKPIISSTRSSASSPCTSAACSSVSRWEEGQPTQCIPMFIRISATAGLICNNSPIVVSFVIRLISCSLSFHKIYQVYNRIAVIANHPRAYRFSNRLMNWYRSSAIRHSRVMDRMTQSSLKTWLPYMIR